jgi:hypothetical protein
MQYSSSFTKLKYGNKDVPGISGKGIFLLVRTRKYGKRYRNKVFGAMRFVLP